MSDFKAKTYQVQFRLGLRSRPRWGSLQRSPRPLAGLRGPTGTGGDGKGRGGRRGREGEGSLGERRGRDPTPNRPLIHISGYAPALNNSESCFYGEFRTVGAGINNTAVTTFEATEAAASASVCLHRC